MSTTPADEQVNVDAAIKAVQTGGQKYRTTDGFEYPRADLEPVIARKHNLEQLTAATYGQGLGAMYQGVAVGRAQ